MSILSLARRLRRDNCGLGAMELALVMPVFFMLGLGTIDASRMVAAKIDLEQAAQRTTDFALARRPNSSSGTYLKTEAASAAGVNASDVTVDIYLECDGSRQGAFAGTCASGQLQARYVDIKITRQLQTQFDWAALGETLGLEVFSSRITVTGDSLVRFQ